MRVWWPTDLSTSLSRWLCLYASGWFKDSGFYDPPNLFLIRARNRCTISSNLFFLEGPMSGKCFFCGAADVSYYPASLMFCLQTLALSLSETLSPVEVSLRQQVRTKKYVELMCKSSLWHFLTPLSVNLLLILTCVALAFLTRKLPENFNESRYIFISVSTTVFMWLVFIPSYFSAFYAHQQTQLLSFCLAVNAFITLSGLFLTKVYAVLWVAENKIKVNIPLHSITRVEPSSVMHSNMTGISTASPGQGWWGIIGIFLYALFIMSSWM